MKKLTKDTVRFGVGSMVLGGSAAAVGSAFPGYAGGLSTMGSMMPAIGTIVIAGHGVRMATKVMPEELKPKKKLRRLI